MRWCWLFCACLACVPPGNTDLPFGRPPANDASVFATDGDAEAVDVAPDAAWPDATMDAALPDATEPDATEPDATEPDATTEDCPADMAEAGDVCIDLYEAPNQAGAGPLAFVTAHDGEAWCQDRGKRLCIEAEWVRACEGAAGRSYPYGTQYARGTCNDDKTWRSPNWGVLATYPAMAAIDEATRLYQADPSGSRLDCKTPERIHDLTGNVAEWVVRSFDHANNYDHVMKGCYWSGCFGGAPPSCSFVNPAHSGGFRSYEAGFRCCRDK